jgi:hypothetical protein
MNVRPNVAWRRHSLVATLLVLNAKLLLATFDPRNAASRGFYPRIFSVPGSITFDNQPSGRLSPSTVRDAVVPSYGGRRRRRSAGVPGSRSSLMLGLLGSIRRKTANRVRVALRRSLT